MVDGICHCVCVCVKVGAGWVCGVCVCVCEGCVHMGVGNVGVHACFHRHTEPSVISIITVQHALLLASVWGLGVCL